MGNDIIEEAWLIGHDNICKIILGGVKLNMTWGKDVVCDIVLSKALSHVRCDVECGMLPCATRCRLQFDVEWKLMSSAI